MTEREARKLKVGDRVMWDCDAGDCGTVIDVGYHGATIKWDNGQTGGVDFRGMSKISRATR